MINLTKQEAINLESECEKLLSDALHRDCSIFTTLKGNISVHFKENFGENFVCISKKNFYTPYYFKYEGDLQIFKEILNKIQEVIYKNKDKFKLLLESYHMKFEN